MNRERRSEFLPFLLILLSVLVGSCAQVAGPPGGEPDKTPPRMMSSEPANGSVGVAASDRVIIRFSEAVQPGIGRQVYISPKPKKDPKLKWKRDQLEVQFPDTFLSNQTYVIQVSSAVTDLRNNRLDSSVIVAFSTGKTLDSGHVAGVVTLNGNPQPSSLVGLYVTDKPDDSVRYDSIAPDYLASSNAKGNFEFKFLPKRAFQLIAWNDKNRDERFNPRVESYAVPDRPIDLRNGIDYANLDLAMRTVDTITTQIIAASYSSNKLVRIRLSRAVRPDQLAGNLRLIRLRPVTDSNTVLNPTGLLESGDTATSALTLAVPPLTDTAYLIAITYDSTRQPLSATMAGVKVQSDREKPTLLKFSPGGDKPVFAEDVKMGLIVSEPLDTATIPQEAFRLTLNPGETNVPLQRQWRDPFHLDFVPQRMLAGMQYSFTVSNPDLTDIAGNALGDSTTVFKFTTINPDSLGTISGQFLVDYEPRAKDPIVLTFQEATGKFTLTRSFSSKLFHAELPAGKYLLRGFLDSNRNGVRDLGSVWPLRYSETSAASPDTISVRARFETAGVDFTIK